MNPVECLLAALGACKCIVAKLLRNKINLQDMHRIGRNFRLMVLGKNKDAKIGFQITTRFILKPIIQKKRSKASLTSLKSIALCMTLLKTRLYFQQKSIMSSSYKLYTTAVLTDCFFASEQ